jgi:hypothetical protein
MINTTTLKPGPRSAMKDLTAGARRLSLGLMVIRHSALADMADFPF